MGDKQQVWVCERFFCTCEFELSANLASVEALDRSINNKKKGRASLEKKMRQNELPNVEK